MLFFDKAWLQEYRLPMAVALSLHVILLVFMMADFGLSHSDTSITTPKAIQAKLIRLDEKKSKLPEKKKKQPVKKNTKPKRDTQKLKRRQLEQKKKQKQQKKARLKKKKAEQAAKNKALQADQLKKKQALEQQEKLRQKALEQKKVEEALEREARESAFMDDVAEEQVLSDRVSDEAEAMSYIGLIQQAIMANWNRPPSARNGMKVTLQITMFPNGQINDVNITKDGSSGNAAFDRSAITAVEKTDRIPELAQLKPHVFERYYRTLILEFRPEDLRL